MDHDQSRLMQGLVILAKGWDWAACTLVALWLLSGCSDCGKPAWVDTRLVIAGDAAVEEPKEQVVASMDPEAEAGQGKSLGKDKDLAAEFQARCNSIAETVLLHHHLEGWPYQRGCPFPPAARSGGTGPRPRAPSFRRGGLRRRRPRRSGRRGRLQCLAETRTGRHLGTSTRQKSHLPFAPRAASAPRPRPPTPRPTALPRPPAACHSRQGYASPMA